MATLIFNTPPHGIDIENPDVRFLELLISYVNEEYWSAGPGQAALTYEDGIKKRQLILTFYIDQFHIEYRSESEPAHLALGDGDFNHIFEPRVGGDPWALPTKFFVSRDITWIAVKEFYKTGGRSDQITWATKKDLPEWYNPEARVKE